jgi:hypothetical protein
MSERNAAENPKHDCSDARGGQCKVGGTIVHRNLYFGENDLQNVNKNDGSSPE